MQINPTSLANGIDQQPNSPEIPAIEDPADIPTDPSKEDPPIEEPPEHEPGVQEPPPQPVKPTIAE